MLGIADKNKQFRQSKLNIPLYEDLIRIYQCGSLELFLKDDDISGFQKVSDSPLFDFDRKIVICNNSHLNLICIQDSLSIAQFTSFYGSEKCFSFALLNELHLEENVCPYAIAGGSMMIIARLPQQV